jgi:hypothetical protein
VLGVVLVNPWSLPSSRTGRHGGRLAHGDGAGTREFHPAIFPDFYSVRALIIGAALRLASVSWRDLPAIQAMRLPGPTRCGERDEEELC